MTPVEIMQQAACFECIPKSMQLPALLYSASRVQTSPVASIVLRYAGENTLGWTFAGEEPDSWVITKFMVGTSHGLDDFYADPSDRLFTLPTPSESADYRIWQGDNGLHPIGSPSNTVTMPATTVPVTYATLDPSKTHADIILEDGNLTGTLSVGGVWRQAMGNIGISSGKWYWETKKDAASTDSSIMIGISTTFHNADHYLGKLNDGTDWGYFNSGQKTRNAAMINYGSSFVKGDVIGVALDMDAGRIYFYKNGVIQNSGTAAFIGITGTVYPSFTLATFTAIGKVNFGETLFDYGVPSGYNAGVYTS